MRVSRYCALSRYLHATADRFYLYSNTPMRQPPIQPVSASSYFDGGVSVDSNTQPQHVDSSVPFETSER
jgi:hypothetical protein